MSIFGTPAAAVWRWHPEALPSLADDLRFWAVALFDLAVILAVILIVAAVVVVKVTRQFLSASYRQWKQR